MSGSVLVTGAAGFLGASLVPAMTACGYQVVGLDDLSTGRLDRIAAHLGSLLTFVQADVRDWGAVRRAAEGVDRIIHLAELRGTGHGHLAMLDVNVRGTENVLEVAAEQNCRVLLGSTEEVYGKSTGPLDEETPLVMGQAINPKWAFPVSKLLAEQLCFAYREQYQVPITILRYGTAHGPHQPLDGQGGPPSLFVTSAIRREAISIGGNGLEVKMFTSVRDLVLGTLLALESPRVEGEIINVGGGAQLSLLELAQLTWALAGNTGQAVVISASGNPAADVPDGRYRPLELSKARALLGYEPTVPPAEGLREAIAWQRSAMDPAMR